MRRLVTCFNALLLGIILGMVFVAIFHAPAADRQTKDLVNRSGLLHHCDIRLAQQACESRANLLVRKRGARLRSCQ